MINKKFIFFFIWIIAFSLSPFSSDSFAEQFSPKEADRYSAMILDKFGHCVYTVHAFSRITDENGERNNENILSDQWRRNVGTAYSVDRLGHLITLDSVVRDAERIQVISNKGVTIVAQILGCDRTGNIAVLKVGSDTDYDIADIAPWDTIISGSDVYFLDILPKISEASHYGFIENVHVNDGTFEVHAPGRPGTSGTPVFDAHEKAIGILAYQIGLNNDESLLHTGQNQRDNEQAYIVISLEYATILAQAVINSVEAECGWLGVMIDMQSSSPEGIMVVEVATDSPAEKSGIKANDRIIDFNGIPTTSSHKLSLALTSTKAGDVASIQIMREGRLLTFPLTLAPHP